MSELPKTYDPKAVEDKLYSFWNDSGFFHAEVNPKKKPYTIVIPPPNVTGQLHMGHAFDETLQDILIRTKRMQGYEALWMPGTDHAGIATQIKVEENLRKEEGKTRYDLGAVVRQYGAARKAGYGRCQRGQDQVRARPLLQDLSALDGERTRLVYFASAVVGSSYSGVLL